MPNQIFPMVYLARHGETAWSRDGRHTGYTDLPLTEQGERNAVQLRTRLSGFPFAKILTSPLQRAKRTCELAGFGAVAEVDPDLVEWNYGDYEGVRTADIRAKRPDWELFRDGCPNGESPADVAERADRLHSRAHHRRQRADFFQRTFPASVRRALAWPRTPHRQISHARH